MEALSLSLCHRERARAVVKVSTVFAKSKLVFKLAAALVRVLKGMLVPLRTQHLLSSPIGKLLSCAVD